MADSASLVASLGVNLAQFKAGLKQAGDDAQKGVKQIEDSFNKANPQLSTFERNAERTGRKVGTLIGLGIVAGITAEFASLKAFDDLAKKAQDFRLQASQITALNYAGANAGVSTDEVEKALAAFSAVSKKTKEDADEFYKALSNIGPAFASAFQNAPTQAARLEVLRQAFASTTDEVKQAQLAQEAFGTDSERIIALFGNAASGLNEYAAAAREAGIQVDDALVQKAAEAERKLQALAQVVSAELKVALLDLIPAIQAVAQALPGMLDAASEAIARVAGLQYATNNVIKRRLSETATALKDFNANTQQTGVKFIDTQNAETAKKQLSDIIELQNIARQRGVPTSARTAREGYGDTLQSAAELGYNPAAQRAFAPRPSLKTPSGGGGGGSDSLDAFDRQIQQIEKLTERLYAETAAVGQSEAAVAKARVTADLYSAAKKAGIALSQETKDKIEAEAEAYGRAALALQEAKAKQEQINSLSADFGQALNGAFDELVIRGGKVKDVLANLARQLASMASQRAFAAIFNPSSGGGTSLFGSLLGGLFGGGKSVNLGGLYHSGGVVGAGGVTRSLPSSTWAGAPRFHNGLMSDEVAAILKKGEVVLTPGQVNALGAASSSGQTIQVVQNNAFQAGMSSQEKIAFARAVRDSAMAGVQDAIKRGAF